MASFRQSLPASNACPAPGRRQDFAGLRGGKVSSREPNWVLRSVNKNLRVPTTIDGDPKLASTVRGPKTVDQAIDLKPDEWRSG